MVDVAAVTMIDPERVQLDGLYLVGEFLGFRERKPRTVNGRTIEAVDVGIRIDGGGIETAQFGGMDYAQDAVGIAEPGDRVAVRVENRHGVKNGAAWQFYTGARRASSFAEEFGV